jgi:hypothetical protein
MLFRDGLDVGKLAHGMNNDSVVANATTPNGVLAS